MDELLDLLNEPDESQPTAPALGGEDQGPASDRSMDTEDDDDAAPTQQSQQQHEEPGASHETPSSPPADTPEATNPEPDPDPIIDPQRAQRARRDQQWHELMTDSQYNRYEAFRRSKLNHKGLRRLVASATGKTLNADAAVVLSSASKMHVGEVVEKAREIAEKRGNYGALLPQDVRAAFAEISRQKCTGSMHYRRRF